MNHSPVPRQPAVSRNADQPASPSMSNAVILADNDPVLRGVLRSVLTQVGLQVFLAADGHEAVEFAHQFLASLVVLDVYMPRMDGLAACLAIRQLPGYATRPIMLLTADNRPSMLLKADRARATCLFTKPVQMDVLLKGLTDHIHIPRALPSGGDPVTARSWGSPIGPGRGPVPAEPPSSASLVLRIARGGSGPIRR